jgi:hypothetical protein
MTAHPKRLLVLFTVLLLAVCGQPAQAADSADLSLGKLFYSPAERAAIHRARIKADDPQSLGRLVHLDGIVSTGADRRGAIVNGEVTPAGGRLDAAPLVIEGAQAARLGPDRRLQVGQTLRLGAPAGQGPEDLLPAGSVRAGAGQGKKP